MSAGDERRPPPVAEQDESRPRGCGQSSLDGVVPGQPQRGRRALTRAEGLIEPAP